MSVMYLDESVHGSKDGDFLAVGGFYCSDGDLGRIESTWAEMKGDLGLDPSDPLKWSPQRSAQDRLKTMSGVDNARRKAANLIAGLPIEIVAIVLQERRGTYVVLGTEADDTIEDSFVDWKNLFPQHEGVRHFYLRGVEFAVQRLADHVQGVPTSEREPSRLVLENLEWASNPGKMTKKLKRKLDKIPETDSWVIRDWMERGARAVREAYARWYRSGFAEPYKRFGSLEALGFESTFHECHDEWSDAMQIADFVVGCTGAFLRDVASGKQGVARECVRAIRPRLRANGSIGCGMWGNGFVLWPPNRDLWNTAKGALT